MKVLVKSSDGQPIENKITDTVDSKTGLSSVFKDPNFKHTNKTANKRRAWRPLKHLVSLERSLPFPEDAATYCRIEAPPSFVPAKKYSDISGLPALYTDPHSKLRYSTAEEYKLIQTLPSDIVAGYLALRKAFNPVG